MKKILVVEDDPSVSSVVVSRLEASGFAVTVAEDGQAALEQVYKETPDLVILDLGLPQMPGEEVCRQLRKSELYKELPIIMLTAKDTDADKVIGRVIGADLYIQKPFDTKELIIKIKELLKEL